MKAHAKSFVPKSGSGTLLNSQYCVAKCEYFFFSFFHFFFFQHDMKGKGSVFSHVCRKSFQSMAAGVINLKEQKDRQRRTWEGEGG